MIENWEMFEDMEIGDKFFMIKGVSEYKNHVGICELREKRVYSISFNWGTFNNFSGASAICEDWDMYGIQISPLTNAHKILFDEK